MHLVHVVEVDVGVAKGVDKLAWLKTGDVRHHHAQQGIAGDVERHAQEEVGAALVELQAKLAVSHIELEQRVARRQLHGRHIGDVPGAHDDAARVRSVLYLVNDLRDLVDVTAGVVGPRPPLTAIHGPQVAVLVGPLVPDAHPMLLQVPHIGVALEEPQQFVDDRLEMHLLGGEQREPLAQVAPQLVAKDALRARARSVVLNSAIIKHMLQ